VGLRTVSGENSGLDARRLSDEDGSVRIVLLHGRIRPGEERSVGDISDLEALLGGEEASEPTYRVAALASPVWHMWKRNSLSAVAKTYLPDMMATNGG
jgi:hypothetical protein